ncbi:DUF1178 family protein [Roseovarius arcticus]|uniref:DUF1178 family protein n=1 Tax=Roseovarius arcticus TaxID=2547404 RepID=UPI0011104282|nr:DUF1178 family protein [Roseovarius arcticus]
MIKFSLKCGQDHRFDSWFQSSDAFDKLAARGLINCAVCGGGDVEKSIMAPNIQAGRSVPVVVPASVPGRGSLSTPASPAEQALAEMRRKIEKNSEYVGKNFAAEARKMHEGGVGGERSIHGEARPEEARKLIEDGVPIIPLPFKTARKVN